MVDLRLDDHLLWSLTSRLYGKITDRHREKSKADEVQLAMLCALTANANFKKEGGGKFEAEEFMPTSMQEQALVPEKVLTADETFDKVRMLNKMLGGVEVDLNA